MNGLKACQNFVRKFICPKFKNMSENIFAEVYCPKFYLPKIFALNVVFSYSEKHTSRDYTAMNDKVTRASTHSVAIRVFRLTLVSDTVKIRQ